MSFIGSACFIWWEISTFKPDTFNWNQPFASGLSSRNNLSLFGTICSFCLFFAPLSIYLHADTINVIRFNCCVCTRHAVTQKLTHKLAIRSYDRSNQWQQKTTDDISWTPELCFSVLALLAYQLFWVFWLYRLVIIRFDRSVIYHFHQSCYFHQSSHHHTFHKRYELLVSVRRATLHPHSNCRFKVNRIWNRKSAKNLFQWAKLTFFEILRVNKLSEWIGDNIEIDKR